MLSLEETIIHWL